MVSNGEKVYIVDYDIPVERRGAFYKALERLRKRLGISSWSTQSVLITDNYSLAVQVYRLATRYGRANLWRAEKIA